MARWLIGFTLAVTGLCFSTRDRVLAPLAGKPHSPQGARGAHAPPPHKAHELNNASVRGLFSHMEPPTMKFGSLFNPEVGMEEEVMTGSKSQHLLVVAGVLVSMAATVSLVVMYRRGDSGADVETTQRRELTYTEQVVDLLKLTWPLMLGNTLEWYEYGIYGYTATQISENFFMGSDIATWLGYAVTFIARPFGGLVLGWVADNIGRTVSVQISLFGMLIATVGQGMLPGHYWGRDYETLGFVILIFFRALQGLSAGGEIGAISSYMIETASLKTLGFATMLISFGGSLAFGLAASVVGVMHDHLTEGEMLVWGWRVPFLVSAIPGLIALAGRANIEETGAFLEDAEANGESERQHFREILSRWRSLLVGGFATIGIASMWYVGPIWTVSSVLEESLGPSVSLKIAACSQWMALAVTPFVGLLTDVKGIAWVTLMGNATIAIVSLPVWYTLVSYPDNEGYAWIGITYVYGVAQALAGATIYLFSAELFPTHLRTIGLGMSYNLAVSYFGGLGPVICEVLKGISPMYGPGCWMSFCGLISVLAVLCGLRWNERGLIKLYHRRQKPYFGAEYSKDGELVTMEASKDLPAVPF